MMADSVGHLGDDTLCARCGEIAAGFAAIGDRRLCHGDDAGPSCYELESWGIPPAHEVPFVVTRGLDGEFAGTWWDREKLRKIITNPNKEFGGFWIGHNKMFVYPTREIEFREDGAVAQVFRPDGMRPWRPRGRDDVGS